MSLKGRLTLVGTLAVLLATPRAALADEIAPQARRVAFTFDSRIGYGATFTTGQPFLGAGTGLAVGMTLPSRFHFELGALAHLGSAKAAVGPGATFHARYASFLGLAGAGYDWSLARALVLRPSLVAGGILIAGSTQVGTERERDVRPLFLVGPSLACLVRFGRFHAGADATAFFVPARVAAPVATTYALFGFEQ
ncbi:MAG: hypothetical protein IPG50_07440 [Myxococcales bacterium]|nr:hypothetical protein [Myxococcales bacterium]